MSRMIGIDTRPSGRTWTTLDRSGFLHTVMSSISSAPMMYSLLTAFESFSITCAGRLASLFIGKVFSLDAEDGASAGVLAGLTATMGADSENPTLGAQITESNTINTNNARAINIRPPVFTATPV